MASTTSNGSESPVHLFQSYNDDNNSRDSVQECSPDIFEVEDSDSNSRERKEDKITRTGKKLNFFSIPSLPPVSVPEKIVLCIDVSHDKGIGYTSTDDAKTANPNAIRNEALKMLIKNKLMIAKDTEFAVVSVEPGRIKWLSNLSSEVIKLTDSLSRLEYVNMEENVEYDLTPIFSSVLNTVSVPEQTKLKVMPPVYVIRTIFVYGNSYLKPIINTSDASYTKFMLSPYCTLDVLFLHEKQSDLNNVGEIFKNLGQIISPRSYLLECSRNVTKVFNRSAKLLAHPCQRVSQEVWNF